jgi:hypothetical protein
VKPKKVIYFNSWDKKKIIKIGAKKKIGILKINSQIQVNSCEFYAILASLIELTWCKIIFFPSLLENALISEFQI